MAIAEAAHYYGIDIDDILVVHDDKDIFFGKQKLTKGGGDAGNKGIRSTILHLSDNQFIRVRVGVGPKRFNEDTADFVLSRFYEDQRAQLDTVIQVQADAVEAIVRENVQVAANTYNGLCSVGEDSAN